MLLRATNLVRLLLISGCLGTETLRCAEDLPEQSPFLPTDGATAASAMDSKAGFEFIGMTKTDTKTLVSIRRLADQRSYWIPVGETVAEIVVVGYDAAKDEVTIRAAGVTVTLPLRNHGPVSAAPAAPIPPPTPPPPATVSSALAPTIVPTKPLTLHEEKEMEARMLVTDLLEIGQQQRKAYEEAQRQAAAANPKPARHPPPAPPSAPTGKPVESAPAPAK